MIKSLQFFAYKHFWYIHKINLRIGMTNSINKHLMLKIPTHKTRIKIKLKVK